MEQLLFQVVIPFILSALIVILIMFVAERYGTKTGGILGTLPSTIVVAFLFISYNKGVDFASESAAIVPAEIGINIIFLFFFALLVKRSVIMAFSASFIIWAILSIGLIYFNIVNIFISIGIFCISLIFSFCFLEYFKKVKSKSNVKIHYTTLKIALRGVLAGAVIAIAVVLSNTGAILSGIFSVFPAILLSTMLISVKEHGPDFAAGMAKSMITGIGSVATYAAVIHFLYPLYGEIFGSIIAYFISFIFTMIVFAFRKRLS